jgi:hypothetical protein
MSARRPRLVELPLLASAVLALSGQSAPAPVGTWNGPGPPPGMLPQHSPAPIVLDKNGCGVDKASEDARYARVMGDLQARFQAAGKVMEENQGSNPAASNAAAQQVIDLHWDMKKASAFHLKCEKKFAT